MDKKAIFARTRKGEDEISGKSADLYSAIKRVLLMIDGVATFGEISKRAAPSLRNSLDDMFLELEKGGYISDQVKGINQPKTSIPPGMVVPTKSSAPPGMIVPRKTADSANKPSEAGGNELDFMTEFLESTPAQLVADANKVDKLQADHEEKAKREADAAKLKAQQQAEAAAREAAWMREEAERAKQVAEAARVKAAQEAALLQEKLEQERLVREKLEAAKLKVEREAQMRLEQAAKAKQQEETARMIAAHQAALARKAAEASAEAERLELAARQLAQANQVAPKNNSASEIKLDPFVFDLPTQTPSSPPPSSIDTPHKKIQPAQTEHVRAAPVVPEVKLDPILMLDQFQVPTSSAVVSAVEVEPEIKLDASIFDAQKVTKQPGNVAHADQAKQIQQPVTQAAPPPVAPPLPESKASQEQKKWAENQRIAAEAQAKALAEAQAKTWAEAERRAIEAAKASVLSIQKVVPATVKTNSSAPMTSTARAKRRPLPWGKLLVFVLVLLVGALFGAPYVLPMRDYMPKVEQMLSAKLQQPVHIGTLSGRILPTPRLELGEVYVGSDKQFQVQKAEIYFAVLGLFNETKPIDNIDLHGVKVTGAGLIATSAWLQKLAVDAQYPVQHMAIIQGTLDADAVQLPDIVGELFFNQDGEFRLAKLRAKAGNIRLDINAGTEKNQAKNQEKNLAGKPQVALTLYNSAFPWLPSWSFDELTAKGELSSTGLRINDLDGRLLGGILQGSAEINWHSGWRAQGTLAAKTITMQNMSQGLSGDLDGSARFQMQAASLSNLADTVTLDGTFIVSKGTINGIDIVETARSRSKVSVPGGRTHFDELSGVLTVTNTSYALRQLKMSAGALVVTGALDITRQQLSGRISADLTKWAGMGKVTMQVEGTINNPALQGN